MQAPRTNKRQAAPGRSEMKSMKVIAGAMVSLVAALVFSGTAAGQQAAESTLERLIDAGKVNEARAMLHREIEAGGQTPGLLYLEAKILFKEQNYPESIAILGKLFGAPPAPFESSNLEAWRGYLDGHRPEALTLMGMNHVLLGNPSQAEPFLAIAAGKLPSDSGAQFRLALLFYTTNRFTEAAAAARAVIGLRPGFGKAHEILGLSLEELRRGPEAIAAYRQAIELNRSSGTADPSPYISLGKALLHQAEYPESSTLLRQALKLNPDSEEASFLLGKVLYKLESDAESERWLRRSMTLAPDYAEPRYLLSLLLSRAGRAEEARQQREIFLELHRRRPRKTSLFLGKME